MKQYLREYVVYIDNLISEHKVTDEVIKNHLVKIQFYQHERFIHLIVTFFYALFLFISIGISLINELFVFVTIILICFIVPYVMHYFFLENNVQYLYKQYDMMLKK